MTDKLYPPVHPGVILREEFLDPLGVSAYRLAQATGLSQTHIGQILRGQRAITVGVGLRLAKALGVSERFWINAQARYDIEIEHARHDTELAKVQVLATASRTVHGEANRRLGTMPCDLSDEAATESMAPLDAETLEEWGLQ